jgi:hypothetical protein
MLCESAASLLPRLAVADAGAGAASARAAVLCWRGGTCGALDPLPSRRTGDKIETFAFEFVFAVVRCAYDMTCAQVI